MTTQPTDTAAAEKLAIDRVTNEDFDGHDDEESDKIAWAVIALTKQLTAANERADQATAEAAVLLDQLGHHGNYPGIAPLASAHLALHRRLVEGQRTKGTYEACDQCQLPQPSTVCGRGRLKVTCPFGLTTIRAGVKPLIEFICEGCGSNVIKIIGDTKPPSGFCMTCEFVCEHVPGPEGVKLLDQIGGKHGGSIS